MHPELDPKALYAYLHELLERATYHSSECNELCGPHDLLNIDCGAQTDGSDLVDVLKDELRRLRCGHP